MARRPSPTSQPRWARRRTGQPPPKQHPTLTAEDVEKLKALMKERCKWDEDPRLFQLRGTQAQLEGCDMIIQAPTGSGKTAVAAGPHVWPTSAGKTTIMVCPLLALEDEMVETFRDDFGLTAVAVNSSGGKLTNELVKELLAGTYRIILISPEMLQSPTFINRVLRRPEFAQRILSVVVDEAHCVSHWGADFRKKYASLGIIRAFLPRGTPIIAVTATLTARVRRDLHRVLHFPRSGSRFINLGNDRPNVSIVVRACEHPQNSYADLDFILPLSIASPADIPKTYLYVDDIRLGSEIIDYLNGHLAARAPSLAHKGLIRPYNATLSHEYRRAAMKAFRAQPAGPTEPNDDTAEPSGEQYIRVLVCTDAAGMGCNVGDVDVVVQWKLPKTLSSFVQRAGRAARFKNRTGLAILLVERSAYSVDLRTTAETPTGAPTTKGPKGKHKKTRGATAPKGYAKEHGIDRGGTKKADGVVITADPPQLDLESPDEGLHVFVQAMTCRRKIWADVFESDVQAPAPGVPCCDICTPALFDRCRPGVRTNSRKTKMPDRGHPDLQAYARLEKWREDIFARDHPLSQLDASSILDDTTIQSLTSVGSLSTSQLTELLEPTWIWWPRYGRDLSTLVTSMRIEYRPLPKKNKGKTATLQQPQEAQAGLKRAASEADESPGDSVPTELQAGMSAKRARTLSKTPSTQDSTYITDRTARQQGLVDSEPSPFSAQPVALAHPGFFPPTSAASQGPATLLSECSYAAAPTPGYSSEVGATQPRPVIQSQGLQTNVYPTPLHPASIPYYSPPPRHPPATPVRYAGRSGYVAQSPSPVYSMPPPGSSSTISYPATPSPGYAISVPTGFESTTGTFAYPNTAPALRFRSTQPSAPPYAAAGMSPSHSQLSRSRAAQGTPPFSTTLVYGNMSTHPVPYHRSTSAIPSYPPVPSTPSVLPVPPPEPSPATLTHARVSHPYGIPVEFQPSGQHVAGGMHSGGYPAYPSPAPFQFSP